MRNLGARLLVILVLVLLGSLAWLSRNPESPWLEQAQEWPMVGELARQFRTAYLGPEANAPQDATESESIAAESSRTRDVGREDSGRRSSPPRTTEATRTSPVLLGRPAPPDQTVEPPKTGPQAVNTIPLVGAIGGEAQTADSPLSALARQTPTTRQTTDRRARRSTATTPPAIPYQALEWKWYLPGQPIRASAADDSELLTALDAMAYLPVLTHQDRWAEVRYRDRPGWVDTLWKPSHKRRGARRGILRHRLEPVQKSDTSRLWEARKTYGLEESDTSLGPYKLFTDVEDQALLDFLASAAAAAEEAYFARYGRLPSGNPYRSAVLFARRADYQSFYPGSDILTNTAGHASRGVLVFFAEGKQRIELARTLVHEITHLVNSRALAYRLPPWLEEGLATDLGSVWVENSSEVASDPAIGERYDFIVQGLDVRMLLLERLRATGQMPSLATLLTLDRAGFYANGTATYPQSAALIRYLLDGHDGVHAAAFMTFLKRIAAGQQADLLKLLERDIVTLDREFQAWLADEAHRIQEQTEQRTEAFIQRVAGG